MTVLAVFEDSHGHRPCGDVGFSVFHAKAVTNREGSHEKHVLGEVRHTPGALCCLPGGMSPGGRDITQARH